MKTRWIPALVAISLTGAVGAASPRTPETQLTPMPPALETQFALSAAPPASRDQATVYLLDPRSGYRLARQGTSGLTCIVQRTAWEHGSYRDDIYIPLCYDTVGTQTYLKYIMDAATLRAQGMSASALKAEIERRFANRTYTVPQKAGVSYMVAPVMRTGGPPDMQVHTMAMPHLMFYAPHVTNADIAAHPDLHDHSSLLYPFIDRQGNDEQSYMIQLLGATEKAGVLATEKPLIDALCAYRSVLCLAENAH